MRAAPPLLTTPAASRNSLMIAWSAILGFERLWGMMCCPDDAFPPKTVLVLLNGARAVDTLLRAGRLGTCHQPDQSE
jgi:hypothetical protein